MPRGGNDRAPGLRRGWPWLAAAALGVGLLAIPVLAKHAGNASPPSGPAWWAVDEAAIPDDTVLRHQLDAAIDLRRREHFDRVLDARDPGELVEHATITDVVLDRRSPGIDALKIVGDELFGYPFRPENGWGGKADRAAVGFTPRPRRV